MTPRVIVVVGAGPGIGASVARRFGRDGYDVALLARSAPALERLAGELQGAGVTVGWTPLDITDSEALTAAVTRFGEHLGRIDVLHFNPSAFRAADPLQLTPEDLLTDLAVGVAALLPAVRAARPFMPAGARVLATGSMAADRPSPAACSLGVQKAALRNLVLSLDESLAPAGIRAASLTVRGVLAPETAFSPDRVAAALHGLCSTADAEWRAEVPYPG